MRGSGLFALRMAWRETRGAHRHFVYFLVCITVGVAALVGVQSFADSLTLAIARSAKSLLGADVEIRATRPLSPGSAAVVAGLTREGVAVTRVRELVAMAQAGAGPRAPVQLVELKAVEQGYPFYGRLVTDPDRPLASLVGHGKALVHPSRNDVYQAIGHHPNLKPARYEMKLAPGDWLIVTSDGLHAHVEPEELQQAVASAQPSAARLASALVDLANQKGGSDNCTVVAVRCY